MSNIVSLNSIMENEEVCGKIIKKGVLMKKNIILLMISIFLLTNCIKSQKTNSEISKNKEKIDKKEIKIGMDKKEVEEILGKNYRIYKSETKMMEIWFYDEFYVGFDKNGKVIKFDMYEKQDKKEK
ncbi:MAG: hypothetical protein NC915_01390 [Candidatus Omnitrophica bacterium]|nr:hypothetical protein [Candidatus Omnitrophota bacterium]